MKTDEDVIQRLREGLAQDRPDALQHQRLQRARLEALDALEHGRRATPRPWLRLGLAAAGIAALALLLVPALRAPSAIGPEDAADGFEIASSGVPLEFYEDLEFYAWLDQNGPG